MTRQCYPFEYSGENPLIHEITLEQLGDCYTPTDKISIIRNGDYLYLACSTQPVRRIAIRNK